MLLDSDILDLRSFQTTRLNHASSTSSPVVEHASREDSSSTMELYNPNRTDRERIVQEVCHADAQNASHPHFDAFMRFYTSIWRCPDSTFSISVREPVLKNHVDVMKAVDLLKQNATLPKSSFQNQAFGETDALEKEHVVRRIVKVAFMIDCASKDDFSDNYQLYQSFPVRWASTQSFVEFLERTFAITEPRSFHGRFSHRSLRAWKLKKRYGTRFMPTDDLVQHLLYDPRSATLKIFHHTAFIKANLLHTAKLPLDTKFGESVQL